MAPLLIEKEGVSIRIQSREHLPPHIHASYGDEEALINIRTGKIFAGFITPKKLKVIKKWLNNGKKRKMVEENFYELYRSKSGFGKPKP